MGLSVPSTAVEAFLWTLFGLTAVMAVVTVLVVLLAIRAVRRSARVVPEVPTRAPVAWRASIRHHARLHRQLQATVAAVRASIDTSSSSLQLAPLAKELEAHAVSLDDQLVVAARAPSGPRARMLRELDAECQALSDAGRRIIALSSQGDVRAHRLDAVTERLDALDAALRELDERPVPPAGQQPGTGRRQLGSS